MQITADFHTLMKQASGTAQDYMCEGQRKIDQAFGDGYAAEHPELVATFMQVAASDFNTASTMKIVEALAEEIGGRLGQIAEAFSQNGTGSLADAIAQVAEAIEQQ